VKLQGEFTWHKHDDTDEFFLVLSGQLTIQMRDRDVILGPRELFVVPRGAEHCPRADIETAVLLPALAGLCERVPRTSLHIGVGQVVRPARTGLAALIPCHRRLRAHGLRRDCAPPALRPAVCR